MKKIFLSVIPVNTHVLMQNKQEKMEEFQLLATDLVEKYGIPQLLYISGSENSREILKVLNRVFQLSDFRYSDLLEQKISPPLRKSFWDCLEYEAVEYQASHIAILCSHDFYYACFFTNPQTSVAYTLIADSWDNILDTYHEIDKLGIFFTDE